VLEIDPVEDGRKETALLKIGHRHRPSHRRSNGMAMISPKGSLCTPLSKPDEKYGTLRWSVSFAALPADHLREWFARIQDDDLDPAILLTASRAVVRRFGARLAVADSSDPIGRHAVSNQKALSR
jgi:hypothetical protein